ncbi:MAG: hypothetical protein JW809_19170 [Pirellulales bacterium]|nr:hypothetical protein [Pirellulales bacterium]
MRRWVWGMAAVLAMAIPAPAAVVPVVLTLDPATDAINTAHITASLSVLSDSDDSTVTGTMNTNLTLDFNPVTRQVTSLTGLEFTGGRVYFSDIHLEKSVIFVGGVTADGTNLEGTFDTPDSLPPPGAVTGGQFNAGDHTIILDHGTFTIQGTGNLSDDIPLTTLYLDDDPIEATTEATGTLSASLQGVSGYVATYGAVLVLPLTFEQTYTVSGFSVVVAGEGTLQARGTFTVQSPPLPGDANKDGEVDKKDAALLAANWLRTGTAVWHQGDFNADHNVNDLDLAILSANWGASLAAAAVPEPSALAGLAALVLLALCRAARRR